MLVANSPALEVRDLVKRYGDRAALAGLDLDAPLGRVTAVLGPNGAGKTTTIESCEGLRRPGSGRIRVLGLDPERGSVAPGCVRRPGDAGRGGRSPHPALLPLGVVTRSRGPRTAAEVPPGRR